MLAGWFDMQLARRRNWHALNELTDEQLGDIGLSRGQFGGSIYPRPEVGRVDTE